MSPGAYHRRILALWWVTQAPNIIGFAVSLGKWTFSVGFTWPFQSDGKRRWPFYNGQTFLWGALRWYVAS